MKLKINNLKKVFGDNQVLKGISLLVNPGEVVSLIGSSGSGKSTLLRCINLLEVANSGSIALDDMEIVFDNKRIKSSNEIQVRKKVGIVFQQFNLWPHLTVLQNLIKAPTWVLKRSKQDAIVEAQQLLTKVGLLDKINSYPAQLSGGQQQRVAIARTLMMHPEIILFDEPTSALDPLMTQEVLRIIRKLATEGMTMIIATHEIDFAREVASHTMFMEHGQVVEYGLSSEVLVSPKTFQLQKFLQKVRD
jgi:ABC-type polar amino acid transport system ATPase subunit